MARVQMREPEAEEQVAPETSDEQDTPEPAAESSDSPLLDLTDAAVKRMIKLAKQRGYVTYDELNEVLPPEVSSEQIEDTMAMLTEMGINVVENEETTEEPQEEAERSSENLPMKVERSAEPVDRTDDPVRMYREMGSVELLSREGEIAIAKRIEAGREAMISGLCESPLTFQPSSSGATSSMKERSCSATSSISRRPMPGPMPRLRPSGSSRRSWPPPPVENRRIDPRERRARAAEAQRRRPGGEYGDVLSPEDFDTPRIEEEPEEDDEDSNVSLSAMEAELKPRVLETFDRIAKTYKSLRKLQDQEVGEKAELSQSQSRRYKKLREEIIEDVKSLSLNQARVEALVEQLYDINKKLISLEGKLMRLAELPHPARRVPARISGRGARSQLAAPRQRLTKRMAGRSSFPPSAI